MSQLKDAVIYAVAACYEPWLLGALGELFKKAEDALKVGDNDALLALAEEFSTRGNEILQQEDGRGVYNPKFYKKDVAFGVAALIRGYASGDEQGARRAGGFFSSAADYYVTSATENFACPEIAAAWAERDSAPIWLDRVVAMLNEQLKGE
jgi:hypothetical protein